MSSIPSSLILWAIFSVILESVMIWSISSILAISLKPRRRNFDESARTIVFCAVRIIALVSDASRISVVVIPKSRSMPSTTRNSLLHENSSRGCSANLPTTDRLLSRSEPPSCIMSIASLSARMSDTCSEAEITVSQIGRASCRERV